MADENVVFQQFADFGLVGFFIEVCDLMIIVDLGGMMFTMEKTEEKSLLTVDLLLSSEE